MRNPVICTIQKLFLLCVLFASLLTSGCAELPPANNGAKAKTFNLQAGVNFGGWFWSLNHYTNLNNVSFTDKDFDTLISYGISHIRLPLSPAILFTDSTYTELNADTIKKLDNFILMATRKKIALIVDIHPADRAEQINTYAKINTIWNTFMPHARHFPDTVLLETLNEPKIDNPSIWRDYQTRIIQTIRNYDSRHTIIVDGLYSAYYTGLSQLKPLADQNVIYSFHYYNPMTFTHQGAVWSGVFGKFQNIHYPTKPLDILATALTIPQDQWGLSVLHETQVSYNKELIMQEIAKPAAWARQYNVPIYCGEFGVMRPKTPTADRILWHQTMITVLKKYNIPFALWNYIGSEFALDTAILRSIKN